MRAEEGPKKDEVKDNKGRDTSSAPPDEMQVDDETEKSIEIATKVQTDMDVSHHEDRCFACKDGGGEFFFCWVFRVYVPLTLHFLHHSF